MEEPGLRERKKQRTRTALIDAAHVLFCANGFEATTIDRIADAAEVSPRTFFRYFDSKEDVALALADEQVTTMLAAFAAQPPDVPVLTAMQRAAVGVARAAEAAASGADRDRRRRVQDLISTSSTLSAARIERGAARLHEVAELIGTRLSVDPTTDPRPHLLAAVALHAVPSAVEAWRAAGRDAPDSELLEQAFDRLAAGFDQPAPR